MGTDVSDDCQLDRFDVWQADQSLLRLSVMSGLPFENRASCGICVHDETHRLPIPFYLFSFQCDFLHELEWYGAVNLGLSMNLLCTAVIQSSVGKNSIMPVTLVTLVHFIRKTIPTYERLIQVFWESQSACQLVGSFPFQSARQDWACILWKDAKIPELVASMRDFIARFRQRPRKMRALPAAKVLSNTLKNFQESLLLIQNLKDDAMRDR